MVQTVQVQANGIAPQGLSTGDIVNTAGGQYIIATPGSPGASYNPDSGYWSTRLDSDYGMLASGASSASDKALENSQLSQQFAREQMQFQAMSNAKAMAFNAAEAQKNRDWQEMLSSTAHQREVADLIAAGLNPILSANAGAATTSGATASGVTSAGASGVVDNSATNSYLNFLAQLLQMKNSMDITKLSAAAGIQQAQLSASAVYGAALLNSAAMQYAADQNLLNNREQREWDLNNPNNPTQAITRLVNHYLYSGPDSSAGRSGLDDIGDSINRFRSNVIGNKRDSSNTMYFDGRD